jgi:hypothetical protein
MNVTDKLRGATKSVVMWFNFLMLAALPAVEYAKEVLPELAGYLAPDTYRAVGLIVVVVNIALRLRTSTSLEEK